MIRGLALLAALSLAMMPVKAETLVIAAASAPGGFDGDSLRPATREVAMQVYEGLTAYRRVPGENGQLRIDPEQVVPHLAESWTISPDGKQYDFTLRQGVKSPYGNELTAEDVAWSWKKSMQEARTGKFIIEVAHVVSVEPVSRYQVRFTLSAPTGVLLRALAGYVPSIYDSTEVRKHATVDDPLALQWMADHAAGFGAYQLASLTRGQQAIFTANPNYFGLKPFFDRVVYREVPSPASRLQLLKAGQVQWAEALRVEQIRDLRTAPNVHVAHDLGTIMANVRMNANFKPFDDLRVRQALAYATDYTAIGKAVFNGEAPRVTSVLPPAVPDSKPGYFHFETDIPRAKALLAEAGYPNGIDITLTYSDAQWFEEGIAIQLKESFARAGIRLTLEKKTEAEVLAATAKRQVPFFFLRDSPLVLDPFYKLYIDSHPKGASNRNDFADPEYARIVDQGLQELDPATRTTLAQRAQQIHADAVTWIYLFYPGVDQAMASCIQGYTWYPDNTPHWAELSCRH